MMPFKIYTRLSAQNRFKRHCANQNSFSLITRTNRFLPFIIKRDLILDQIESWEAYDLEGGLAHTVVPQETGYEIYTLGTSQYIIYYGAIIDGLVMECGSYYLKISDGTNDWFSEVFTVGDFTTNGNPYAVLEWSHSHDVGDIIYQTGYVNRLYLDIELGEPDYITEEEVSKDVLGNEIDILVRTQKQYKSTIAALPEYLVDSLTLSLQGADEVSITLPENQETIAVIQARAQVLDWINDGCSANVELRFKVEESLVSKTCNSDSTLIQVAVNPPESD